MYNQQLFTGQYTKTLSMIYPTYEEFLGDFTGSGLPNTFKDAEFLKTIYLVLMSEYMNSSIMSFSEDQFRLKFLTRIMSYGPQYEREFGIQTDLLSLSNEELQVSAKAIYNTAMNPSEAPTTDTLDELPTINQQNTTKHVRSKLDAWALLKELADDSITKKFIKRFDDLFVRVLMTNNPLWYTTNIESEVIIDE